MSNNETNTSTSTADENPTTTSSGSDSASTCGAVPTSCENTPSACDATPVSTCGTGEVAPSVCDAAPAPMSEPSGEARRVQLNPTIDEALSKAIPSLAVEPTAPSATVVPKGDPIEVPRAKDTSLDEQTEAEIAAAMAGVDAAVASAQAVEGTPGAVPPAAAAATKDPKPGSKHKGRVQAVHGDSVIVDIGARSSGILPARLFEETKLPEVGATLDVVVEKVDPEGSLSLALARATVSKPAGNWDQVAVDQIVDCTVTKTNKGGLEVNVSNLRGFMPAGQVDFGFVSNLEGFVGQKLRVKILEVNAQKRNLVVSRRAFLEISRAEQRDEMWKKLEVGQIYKGTVKTVKDYGAFIDIGGVDGLLHVGEMSWTRVNHPKDVVSEGQQVEVSILAIDREKSKVSLGMKQLQANPWQTVTARYAPSSITRGKVAKVTDFGAFVELEPGLEGLIHISELEHRRVNRVTDVVNVGQEIDVQVLSIDLEKRRIALSRKALLTKPESARSPEEDLPAAAAYERKRKGPLKGGGTGSGGFTFGRPDEY